MNRRFREELRGNGSREHVTEFGGHVGVVTVPMFEDSTEFWDVRWLPSKLRYGYSAANLSLSRKKVRGWRNKQRLAELRGRA